jgi:hypothetical protein
MTTFQSIPYAIGAVFLLAGLVMLASRARQILPGNLGRFAMPALVLGALAMLGAAGKDAVAGRISGWFETTPPAAAVVEVPAAKQQAPQKARFVGRVSAEFDTPVEPAATKAAVVVEAPVVKEEVAVDPELSAAPGENHPKKVMKSVGKFFHIGHKKPPAEP